MPTSGTDNMFTYTYDDDRWKELFQMAFGCEWQADSHWNWEVLSPAEKQDNWDQMVWYARRRLQNDYRSSRRWF